VITSPRQLLHRIAQGNSPWVAYAGTKFEQRFDDPEKQFLVLYAGSSRLGCFIECLAHFRRAILPGFEELEGKFGPTFPQGAVPATWCTSRSSQSTKVTGIFADVAQSAWLSRLQTDAPAILLQELHAGQIDQSTIHQARFRPITQWVARYVFQQEAHFAGIYYTSRHGSEFSNWAIFEGRPAIEPADSPIQITENDADLLAACQHLQIHAPSGTRTQAPSIV